MRGHLKLVEPSVPLNQRGQREEFERLTQRLVDLSIEMLDLVDGDCDLENGDNDDDRELW